MTTPEIDDFAVPEDLRDFILRRVESIGHLEALLLLWRTCDQRWIAPDVAQKLYIREPQAADILNGLSRLGLIMTDDGHYWFGSQSALLYEEVSRLSEAYSRRLIEITKLIHSKPASRIQEFADAFKLKKDR